MRNFDDLDQFLSWAEEDDHEMTLVNHYVFRVYQDIRDSMREAEGLNLEDGEVLVEELVEFRGPLVGAVMLESWIATIIGGLFWRAISEGETGISVEAGVGIFLLGASDYQFEPQLVVDNGVRRMVGQAFGEDVAIRLPQRSAN